MNNPWPAAIVGVVLVALGTWLLFRHRRNWQRQQADPALSDSERIYFHQRYRRRMQTAAIIALLGCLIGVGDALLPLQKQPLGPTLYWIGVLLLTGYLILLALSEVWLTAAHAKAELARHRLKRHELERQVVEFKHRYLEERGSSPDRQPPES